MSNPKNSFLTTAPPPHILFTCYPLLPPPLSERAHAPALYPPQSSHRLTFPTFSPATTSQDPCLSGVPACSILLQRLRVNSPGFKDPYCLQITIKFNYLKICWLYDQTVYDDCLEIYLFLLSSRPVVTVWWSSFYGQVVKVVNV